ncbi:hypothetical protein ACFX1R_028467 [Malus domestica]
MDLGYLKHLDLSVYKFGDSVGFLDKLVELNLSGCSKLTRFETRPRSRSLEWLCLDGCTMLESFPQIEEDKMKSLTDLNIEQKGCENLTLIGTSLLHIYGLQHLIVVTFVGCPKAMTFWKNKVKFDEGHGGNSCVAWVNGFRRAGAGGRYLFVKLFFNSPNMHALKAAGCTAYRTTKMNGFPCLWEQRVVLGKRPCPRGSSDVIDDEYDQQQQWISLSPEPMDDHPKRRHIDRSVPITTDEEQGQPSTSIDRQYL